MDTNHEQKNYFNIEEAKLPSFEDTNCEMYADIEERKIAHIIAAHKNKQCDKVKYAGWNGKTCWDCGAILPKTRVSFGRVRCINCQEDAEKRGEA